MKLRQTVSALVTVLCGNGWLKMLGLCQNCLHLTFEQYLRSETYSRKNEKLPNIVILACKNITEKMHLLKMSSPQIWLCLFTFRPIASKKIKWLDYNRYCQLTRWCIGNASARFGCKRSRVQSPDPARVFMFHFLLCCCCVFTFLSKKHTFIRKVCNSFYNGIFLVFLTYCKICDRL